MRDRGSQWGVAYTLITLPLIWQTPENSRRSYVKSCAYPLKYAQKQQQQQLQYHH